MNIYLYPFGKGLIVLNKLIVIISYSVWAKQHFPQLLKVAIAFQLKKNSSP